MIILTTLEKCLSNQSKDTARFEEAMNVKLLLREISQFIGKWFLHYYMHQYLQIKEVV